MTRPVPAATATLRVLRFLAAQAGPSSATAISTHIGLPRSSTYHLLRAMESEGFVTHFADEKRWGIGLAAHEVGLGYARQEPIARLARIPMARLVDALGESAHLGMLHGREVVYVVEERAIGRPPLVTDVGVRLPAHLTASGRAVLATLRPAQVRALFPNQAAFVDRTGTGPQSPSALRRLLSDTRQRGYATEDGEVTPGFASLAVPVTSAPSDPTLTSIAVTFARDPDRPGAGRPDAARIVEILQATAAELTRRLGGRTRPHIPSGGTRH